MFAYSLTLGAISLLFVVLYFFLGKHTGIEPPVYYLSVGFSLLLSLLLPYGLASVHPFGLILVYLLLIAAFALGLTWAREQYLAKHGGRVSADPENRYVGKKVGQLALDTPAPSFAKVLADEVAALEPAQPETDPFSEAARSHGEEEEPLSPAAPAPSAPQVEEVSPPAAGDATVQETPEQLPERTETPQAPDTASGREERERHIARLRALFQALARKPPREERARLTLEASEAYRELGQYWQAAEVIRTFLAGGLPADGAVLNGLIVNAAYCHALWTILRDAGYGSPPHAGLPPEVKSAAKSLAGRLILEGRWHGEKIA